MWILFFVTREYTPIIERITNATARSKEPIRIAPIRTKGKKTAIDILYSFFNSGTLFIFSCDSFT